MPEQEKINIQFEESDKRHRFLKIIVILIILGLVIDLLLQFMATPMLRSGIKSMIQKESKGLYTADFERLSITILTTGLELKNFTLTPDTAIYNKRKKEGTIHTALYQIKLESLHFKRLHILKLIRRQILEFKTLEINGLSFSLLGLPDKAETKNDKYDVVHKDLYMIIKPYLTALKIREVYLNDGYLDMQLHKTANKKTAKADKISVRLKNFSLDSAAYTKRDKLFFSDSLHITIDNYSLFLNDSTHQVFAKKAVLSVADSTIHIVEAGLYPVSYDPQNASQRLKPMYYIAFESINLSGVDIYKAWFDKKIHVRNVTTENPVIKVISPRRNEIADTADRRNMSDFKDLYQLIEGQLSEVNIEQFSFEKAKLKMFRNIDQTEPAFSIDEFSLNLEKFLIDENSTKRYNKFLYADQIEMEVKNYSMRIAQNSHILQVDSFRLSTRDELIDAFGLLIKPVNSSGSGKLHMNIKIPILAVNGADLITAYNSGYLSIDKLTAQNPAININKYAKTPKAKTQKIDVLYGIVSEYMNAIKINQIRLNSGQLSFNQNFADTKTAFYKGNISMSLRDFSIDNKTAARSDRLFYAAGFEINLTNYSMKSARDLHLFELGRLYISSFDSKIEIENLAYFPKISESVKDMMALYGKNSLTNFYVDKIEINDIDVKELIFRKNLKVDNITITYPKLFIQKYGNGLEKDSLKVRKINRLFPIVANENVIVKSENTDSIAFSSQSYKTAIAAMLSDYIEKIDLHKLNMDSAYVHITNYDSTGRMKTYYETNCRAYVTEFKFDTDSLLANEPLVAGRTDLEFENITLSLPDKFHKVRIGDIKYSTGDSSFVIKNLRMIPGKQGPKLRPANTAFIPEMRISGINIDAFLKNREINADSLIADGARIIIVKPDKKRDSLQAKKPFKLPPAIKGFNLNGMRFSEGRILLAGIDSASEHEKLSGNFTLDISEMKADPGRGRFPFSTSSSQVIVTDFKFNFRDSIYTLKADSISFSPENAFLLAENLTLDYDTAEIAKRRFTPDAKTSAFRLTIPKLRAAEIDITAFTRDKTLDIGRLDISSGDFAFNKFINSGKDFKIADFETEIQTKLTKNIKNIQLDKIEFAKTNVTYTDFSKPENKIIHFADVSGKIKNFNTDTALMSSERMFLSEDISLKKKNISQITKDSSQLISIKELGLSTKERKIRLTGFSMQPTLSKYEIIQSTDYSASITYFDNANISLINTDLIRLIQDKALRAESAEINQLQLNLYSYSRDKENLNDTVKINPWLRIHDIKMPITIRNIDILSGDIFVEQQSPKSTKTGTLSINRLTGNLKYLSNEPAEIAKNPNLRAKVTGYLQDEGYIKVSFRLPLDSTIRAYSIGGTADTFDLRIFNPFLENTAFFSIEKGTANRISFFVDVDGDRANCKMNFFYSDLSIKKIDSTASVHGLYSSAANAALRDNNPKNRYAKLKEGQASYMRPKHKSVFSLWTHALVNGAISSVTKIQTGDMRRQGKIAKNMKKLLKKEEREKASQIRKEHKELNKDLNSSDKPNKAETTNSTEK